MRTIIALLLLGSTAQAADKVMILKDKDQQSLLRVIDASLKAHGIAVLPDAARLFDAYNAAGTLQDQKPVTEPPKEEPK